MSKHILVHSKAEGVDEQFVCTVCGMIIGFNRADKGSPSAVDKGGSWETPDNPDQWMDVCQQ